MLSRAFTLIELLVVITVIALLMGILLPTLNVARKQAASTACQSNMRQLTLAMNLYTLDNEGKAMPFTHTRNEYWFHQLAPFLSAEDFKNDPEAHQEQMKVAFCPSANKRRTENDWGTALTAWRFMGGEGSYGLNLWLLPENTQYQELDEENYYKKYTDAHGDAPVLGDSVWVGSWPDSEDIIPDDLSGEIGYPGYPHQPGRFMGRFCIDRHRSAINIGFADTRVERVKLADLWKLKWHKKFKPRKDLKKF